MKEFLITGKVTNVEARTSKGGTSYTLIVLVDSDGTSVEIFTGSKVDPPHEGSTILCKGLIRTNAREYQGKTYLSYSFWASKIETLLEKNSENVIEESLQEVSFSDDRILF